MNEQYEIIRLQLSESRYSPTFSDEFYANAAKKFCHTIEELKSHDLKERDYFNNITIPLHKSRIGGSVVDLPSDIEFPEGMSFVAQLNCEEISKCDKLDLLPKKGFIYIFTKNLDEGVVIYSDTEVSKLKRVIKQDAYWYSFGQLIETVESQTELLSQRFYKEDEEIQWSCIAGEDITKIYGIYTNCQLSESEIAAVTDDADNILLLQIGTDYKENGGAQSIYIRKEDLLDLNFSKCKFGYSSS